MKTLAKIIKRLLFGPSLEDYEERQKAENVKMVQRMGGTPLIKATVSADERRSADMLAIAKMQSDMQRHILRQQVLSCKGILQGVTGDSGTITVSR